ncbi:hypothetical protein BGZ83_004448, partial [Gryganskiella cystojenkinii]
RRQTVDPLNINSQGFCSSCKRFHYVENHHGVLQFPTTCPSTNKNLTIVFAGDAGTGMNSRIGGHLKFGGNRVWENHMRFIPVLMTDEFLTTKTCPYCWCRVQFGRSRKKEGAPVRRTHGVVRCTNQRCLSVQVGYSRRGRDTNASFNILLRGELEVSSEEHKVPDV